MQRQNRSQSRFAGLQAEEERLGDVFRRERLSAVASGSHARDSFARPAGSPVVRRSHASVSETSRTSQARASFAPQARASSSSTREHYGRESWRGLREERLEDRRIFDTGSSREESRVVVSGAALGSDPASALTRRSHRDYAREELAPVQSDAGSRSYVDEVAQEQVPDGYVDEITPEASEFLHTPRGTAKAGAKRRRGREDVVGRIKRDFERDLRELMGGGDPGGARGAHPRDPRDPRERGHKPAHPRERAAVDVFALETEEPHTHDARTRDARLGSRRRDPNFQTLGPAQSASRF